MKTKLALCILILGLTAIAARADDLGDPDAEDMSVEDEEDDEDDDDDDDEDDDPPLPQHQSPDGGQQNRQLDREQIERILAALGPACRDEMQQALTQQGSEISDTCKMEIQQVMQADGMAPGGGPPKRKLDHKPHEGPFYSSPTFFILLFLIALVGGIAYFVMYVNAQQKRNIPAKGTAAYDRWERRQEKRRKKKAGEGGKKRR